MNGTVSPAATVNSPTVLKFSPCDLDRRAQQHHVGPGDGAERAVGQAADPRHDGAVAEARRPAPCTSSRGRDSPATMRTRSEVSLRSGMKSISGHGAVVGLEPRFQDQRVVAILPA